MCFCFGFFFSIFLDHKENSMSESSAWMERMRKRRAFADPELDRINEETINKLRNLYTCPMDKYHYPNFGNSQECQQVINRNILNIESTNTVLEKSDTAISKPVLKFSIDAILSKS